MVSCKELITDVLSIAKEAATAVMGIYHQKTYQIKSKLDNSPVTEADFCAHRIIKKGLQEMDPTLPVLSEEGNLVPFEIRSRWSRFWLVDPLDGTQEFIRGSKEFTINIALIENHVPIFGMMAVPALQQYFWAVQGEKAYMQLKEQERLAIQSHAFRTPVKIVVSPRYLGIGDFLKRFTEYLGAYEIDYCGSALKICLVAKGEKDLYPQFGATREWDTAAGQCILEAAGGQLVDLTGHPLKYNQRDTLENPPFYALSRHWKKAFPVDKMS